LALLGALPPEMRADLGIEVIGVTVDTPAAGEGKQKRRGELVVRHFCADKGYDYEEVYRVASRLGYRLHIAHRRRGEPEPAPLTGRRHPARRWVVERTNSWHNRFRALKIRWEKKPENYEALLHIACALITARFLG
jgi:putative transposase